MYYIAAILLFLIGIAHSYLGERYILIRLFRRNDLPILFGGTEFTQNTLRFAWHLTTVTWFGFAFILVSLASDRFSIETIAGIIGVIFSIHFVVSFLFSKGRHFSWLVFLIISLAIFVGMR